MAIPDIYAACRRACHASQRGQFYPARVATMKDYLLD